MRLPTAFYRADFFFFKRELKLFCFGNYIHKKNIYFKRDMTLILSLT